MSVTKVGISCRSIATQVDNKAAVPEFRSVESQVDIGPSLPEDKARVPEFRSIETQTNLLGIGPFPLLLGSWGKSSPIQHGLIRETAVLRAFYGDAGALEILASATRLLSKLVVVLDTFPHRLEAKVAVVAGMAAKLTQTDAKVFQLWERLSPNYSKQQLLQMELRLMAPLGTG